MKVLVTGAQGQLGYDVMRHFAAEGFDCFGTDLSNMDLTNAGQVNEVITSYSPDVVVHCAAYTAVDKAEDDKERCYVINVLGTRAVAEACRAVNAKMVYISTDYVFDGEGELPFEVTDQPRPINYYGQTKYEGELEVQRLLERFFIVRTSWVFGTNGANFVKTMLRLGREQDEISVVSDQIGSPTSTADLAVLLGEMIQTDRYGVYHATNEGYCSWYDFTCEIMKQAGFDVVVKSIKTIDFPTKAKRPKNSRMSKQSLVDKHFNLLRPWQRAVQELLTLLPLF